MAADADETTDESSPAVEQVFATAELVESIFVELPAHYLLVNVQRVCRQWKATIEASTPVQQAMFFKPLAFTGLRYVPSSRPQGPWYRDGIVPGYLERQDKPGIPRITCMHPNYLDLWEYTELGETGLKGFEHPNASWRRQLLTQPSLPQYHFVKNLSGVLTEEELDASLCVIKAPQHGFTMQNAREELDRTKNLSEDMALWRKDSYDWKTVSVKAFLEWVEGPANFAQTTHRLKTVDGKLVVDANADVDALQSDDDLLAFFSM